MITATAPTSITAMREYVLTELHLNQSPATVAPLDRRSTRSPIAEFSDETVIEMHKALQSSTSELLREQLQRGVANGRSDRILASCRYRSLFTEGVPVVETYHYNKIMDIPERHGYHVSGSIALSRRIGMAHAALALFKAVTANRFAYVSDQTVIRSLHQDELYVILEEKYPVLVETFANHPDKVVHLHAFLAERGYAVNTDMFDQLQMFAEAPSAALAEGAL